jgi:hypothetical protein
MSDYEKLASAIKPPQEDSISVLAITTSASTAQDTGVSAGGPRYVTVIADVACFITFSNDGLDSAITDPDGTNTSTGARTWRIPADSPQNFLITRTSRYFKARGSAAGYLRWYISSP